MATPIGTQEYIYSPIHTMVGNTRPLATTNILDIAYLI